jgi:hypothetical protein
MYDPFVDLSNQTLDMFHAHSFDGLCESAGGNNRIVFQVNDPCRMIATHTHLDGLRIPETMRVPDFLLLKFGVARDARPTDKSCETWEEHVANGASAPIYTPVKWEQTLCAGEIKPHKASLNKADPPLTWKDSKTPQPGPTGVLPNPNTISAPSPVSVEPQPLSKVDIRTRSGQVSTPVYPSGSHGTKRKSDSSHNESGKRPKHQGAHAHADPGEGVKKDRRLDGAVQTAIYASERLCSRIQISHCFNFLVHGSANLFQTRTCY